MELNEAIDNINLLITNLENMSVKEIEPENYILLNSLNTVLEELNNRISKDELKNTLRKVQDYQLNYKDTVLFNIIMQEIFGETEWINLESKE